MLCVPVNCGQGSRQLVSSRTQSVEPEAEVDGVDRDHRSGYLAADRLPPRICWVIQCQGAPSLKILALIIGLLQDVPQSSDERFPKRSQCVPEHRQFGWSAFEQTAVKKLDLSFIYRKEGQAGVKAFFGIYTRAFDDSMKHWIRPETETGQLLDQWGYILRLRHPDGIDQIQCLLVLVTP